MRAASSALLGLLIFTVVAATAAAHAVTAAITTAAERACPDLVCGAGPVTGQWTRPVAGSLGSGFRTAARPDHDGVDLLAARGAAVRAAAAGVVITVMCDASTGNCDVDGSPRVQGCGWYAEIRHRDARAGAVVTRYCHLLRRPSARVGQQVSAGQVFAAVGSSGNSSGPHLHFEVHRGRQARSGNALSPGPFMSARDANLAH